MASEDLDGLKMVLDDCRAVKCLVTESVESYLRTKKAIPHYNKIDEYLLGIECPSCESMFHLKCIDIGSKDFYKQLGNYITLWRCSRCVDVLSRESQILSGKLIELRQKILLQLKENEDHCFGVREYLFDMNNQLESMNIRLEKMLEIMTQAVAKK